MPIILIIAFIAAGIGIPFKAETAVPGDVLYPVKTHIDEPVETFFSFSQAGRIQAAENQAGARLTEAEQLASSGLLDTATKSSLEDAFGEKASEAASGIQAMAESGDAQGALDQSTSFRTLLEKHQAGLGHAYKAQTDSASLAADMSSLVAISLGRAETLQSQAAQLASAQGAQNVAQASTIKPPEAGGPIPESSADPTTTPNSLGSAILSFLSKVI